MNFRIILGAFGAVSCGPTATARIHGTIHVERFYGEPRERRHNPFPSAGNSPHQTDTGRRRQKPLVAAAPPSGRIHEPAADHPGRSAATKPRRLPPKPLVLAAATAAALVMAVSPAAAKATRPGAGTAQTHTAQRHYPWVKTSPVPRSTPPTARRCRSSWTSNTTPTAPNATGCPPEPW